MRDQLRGNCLPMLIGSLPMNNHGEAVDLILKHTPAIPSWPQLPVFAQEGMIAQFLPGLPCVKTVDDRTFLDTADPQFDEQILQFFGEYMALIEDSSMWDQSRFVLTSHTAQGFFTFKDKMASLSARPLAVKGQITGPMTFCTGLTDGQRRAVFYNETVRDAVVKHLALVAAWQVRQLRQHSGTVIVGIDEPALAGFGSSEFISITKEEILACLSEVVEAIHDQGGLAGIHVCANTDWQLVLESGVDIVNFDAHGYFDKFILYTDLICRFLEAGKYLAWGLVPTLVKEQIEQSTVDQLYQDWKTKSAQLIDGGIDVQSLRVQSLITPSCGTGSLSLELARRVLQLTEGLSERIRSAPSGLKVP